MSTRGKGGSGTHAPRGGKEYDPELVNSEALAVCDYYLGERRREGRRYVYYCPECSKSDFEVEPVKGMAGCFNPACSVPKTTDALGIIAHLEGLELRGRDFIRCLEQGYEILSLTAFDAADSGSRSAPGEVHNGSAGAGHTQNGSGQPPTEDGSPDATPEESTASEGWVTDEEELRPQGRTWVRQGSSGRAALEQQGREGRVDPSPGAQRPLQAEAGRLAAGNERVYPVEAYAEGPDGERIPMEAVIVEEIPAAGFAEGEADDISDAELVEDRREQAGAAKKRTHRPRRTPGAGDRELIHSVYAKLLELCPLEERDVEFFEGRGVDRNTAREGRFGSMSRRRSPWAVRRLRELFADEDLLRVPGFYRPDDSPENLRFSLYGDYALIPYLDPEHFITTVEGRLIGEPRTERDKKYKAPLNSGVHLYVHPRFSPAELVAFCEGAIGAMVAARCGVPVASIKGFRNYKVPSRERGGEDRILPELEGVDFAGREVVYIPDVDVKPASRAEVMETVPAACEWLIRRQGGVPKVALLPEGAKDLDQWLLSMPEEKRVVKVYGLLSQAVSLEDWCSDADDWQSYQDDRSFAGTPEHGSTMSPSQASSQQPHDRGSAEGSDRPLKFDEGPSGDTEAEKDTDELPASSSEDPGTSEEERGRAGSNQHSGTGEPNGSSNCKGRAQERDSTLARKGPMHPTMARWYETAAYSAEQVTRLAQATTVRRLSGAWRPPVRDAPVNVPRWSAGEVILAIALALAVAVALCILAYITRARAGVIGVPGDVITWPVWWLEAMLYAWAGGLTADWMVSRRHRNRRRRLKAHLRGEE
jgi:hypothetical protein